VNLTPWILNHCNGVGMSTKHLKSTPYYILHQYSENYVDIALMLNSHWYFLECRKFDAEMNW